MQVVRTICSKSVDGLHRHADMLYSGESSKQRATQDQLAELVQWYVCLLVLYISTHTVNFRRTDAEEQLKSKDDKIAETTRTMEAAQLELHNTKTDAENAQQESNRIIAEQVRCLFCVLERLVCND